MLHAALRQVLGPQALQSGSYNRPGYLARVLVPPQRVEEGVVLIQVVEGRLFCVDLGSRTGVVWPGGAVNSGGWLVSPSEVRLGSHSLTPRTSGPDGGDLSCSLSSRCDGGRRWAKPYGYDSPIP